MDIVSASINNVKYLVRIMELLIPWTAADIAQVQIIRDLSLQQTWMEMEIRILYRLLEMIIKLLGIG